MRTFTTAVLLVVAGLAEAGQAAAQTPPPTPPPAAPPPAAAPAPPPPAPPPPAPPPAAAPALAAPAAPPAAPAAAAPATPPGNWWDKFSGDAFVDVYGAVNWNQPKPQYGIPLREFDQAQGFAVNWIGLNGSYAADPIGGTISLRFGPAAAIYGGPGSPTGTADNNFGMQNVRQAYATVKPADKWTLDIGKFDQPFGSEVPDSQLNMNYTRSLLFTLNQPLFFTGLRLDYAPIDMIDVKLIAANGWNNTIDNNRGKTFAAQVMIKAADPAIFYIGYAGGPEQADATLAGAPLVPPGTGPTNDNIGANSRWRNLIDFVADINPTKELRFLVNGDYDSEEMVDTNGNSWTESWYGANIGIRYIVADPFQVTVRGEVVHDSHGSFAAGPLTGFGTATSPAVNVESATLTLSDVIASHFTLMLDNRFDFSDKGEFPSATVLPTGPALQKFQFTTTLGVIVATK